MWAALALSHLAAWALVSQTFEPGPTAPWHAGPPPAADEGGFDEAEPPAAEDANAGDDASPARRSRKKA